MPLPLTAAGWKYKNSIAAPPRSTVSDQDSGANMAAAAEKVQRPNSCDWLSLKFKEQVQQQKKKDIFYNGTETKRLVNNFRYCSRCFQS